MEFEPSTVDNFSARDSDGDTFNNPYDTVHIMSDHLNWRMERSGREIEKEREYLTAELEMALFDSAVGWVRDASEDVREHLAAIEKTAPDQLLEDSLIESVVIDLLELPIMNSAIDLLPAVAEDIEKMVLNWWVRVAVHEAAYQSFKASHPDGLGAPYQLVTVIDDK